MKISITKLYIKMSIKPAVITMSSNYSRLSDYVFKKNTVSNMFILRKLK
mgnify:FL=1